MMSKKFKLGKMSVVVLLTALIWVWADLAQDERLVLSNVVTVTVARPNDPNLWVTLKTDERTPHRSLVLDSVVLKGPASKRADAERMKNRGELDLDVFLVPEEWSLTEAGPARTLDALSVLRQSEEIKRLHLTVETCEPSTLTVEVRRLTVEDVAVECVDETGDSVDVETIKPSRVDARVPVQGAATVRVRLNAEERRQAREAPIEKTPYTELADGQQREAAQTVMVKLPPAEDTLPTYNLSPTLGFCMSQVLQGKYTVELQNDPRANPLQIRARPQAYAAYEQMPFHMVLFVKDSDRQAKDYITRRVVLSLPEEYVRTSEIEPVDPTPPEVTFKLVPVPTGTTEPSGM